MSYDVFETFTLPFIKRQFTVKVATLATLEAAEGYARAAWQRRNGRQGIRARVLFYTVRETGSRHVLLRIPPE